MHTITIFRPTYSLVLLSLLLFLGPEIGFADCPRAYDGNKEQSYDALSQNAAPIRMGFKEKLAVKWATRKLKKDGKNPSSPKEGKRRTEPLAILGCALTYLSVLPGIVIAPIKASWAWFNFGVVLALLGLLLCIIALHRIKKQETSKKGRGWAIAGIVISLALLGGFGLIKLIADNI